MSGNPDHNRAALRPYLISPDDEAGGFRLTCRDTRYNGQGYPVVTEVVQEERFATAAATRLWAKTHFGAQPGEFARK